MRKKGKGYFVAGLVGLALFVLWTFLVQTVDVQPLGPAGTRIGFAALNSRFHALTGTYMPAYTVTDWLGLLPVLVCLLFAMLGVGQLLKRKRLRQVDFDLLLLGCYYILVAAAYVLFELFPVNYRPVLIEGRLEASYPSSTTLLVLSVMPTLGFQARRRMKKRKAGLALSLGAAVFSVAVVAGRLLSGVHWLTDIVGSVLLSSGLFFVYKGLVLWWSGKARESGVF